jgi:hypothetical protein
MPDDELRYWDYDLNQWVKTVSYSPQAREYAAWRDTLDEIGDQDAFDDERHRAGLAAWRAWDEERRRN